jgi:hypothetical protein
MYAPHTSLHHVFSPIFAFFCSITPCPSTICPSNISSSTMCLSTVFPFKCLPLEHISFIICPYTMSFHLLSLLQSVPSHLKLYCFVDPNIRSITVWHLWSSQRFFITIHVRDLYVGRTTWEILWPNSLSPRAGWNSLENRKTPLKKDRKV